MTCCGGKKGLEHEKKEAGNSPWENVQDGTARVGIVSGRRGEEEIPIPPEEESPFDGDQFEQAVCDLTGDEKTTVMKCKTCDRTETRRACWDCFESIQDGSAETEMFPIFRGVKETGDKGVDKLPIQLHTSCAKKASRLQNHNANAIMNKIQRKFKLKRK